MILWFKKSGFPGKSKKSTESPFSHELDFTSFEDFTSFLTFMMMLQMTYYDKRRCQMPCVLQFEPKATSLIERKICTWYVLFIKCEIQGIKSKMNYKKHQGKENNSKKIKYKESDTMKKKNR